MSANNLTTTQMDFSPPKRWKPYNNAQPGFVEGCAGIIDDHIHLAAPPTLFNAPVKRHDSGISEGTFRPPSDSVSSTSSAASLRPIAAEPVDTGNYVTPSALHEAIVCHSGQLLLLDCRANLAYNTVCISGAISVQFSALMLRRLKKQTDVQVKVEHLQVSNRVKLQKRLDPQVTVIVYDEESAQLEVDSPAGVLMRILNDEGIRPLFLRGGISTYRQLFPQDLLSQECDSRSRQKLHPVLKVVRAEGDVPSPPTVPSISAISEILDFMYISDASHGCSASFMQSNGISHVINVTEIPFQQQIINLVKCMQIPLVDGPCHDLLSVVPEAVKFIAAAYQQGGRVLIYCDTGNSRAAAIVLAYLLYTGGFSLRSACQHVQRKRPSVRPHVSFMQQLFELEQIMRKSVMQAQSLGQTTGTRV